jgi:type IV pilus assembly protein PilM
MQLKETNNGFQLEHYGIIPILPELIVDGSILDSPRVVEAIKELIRTANMKAKDTVLSVSGHSSVIIKRISLPEMTEEELGESIKYEAEQYVPFDIEDVNIDFQILGPSEEDGQMDVIIVAVKKDKIEEYVTTVKEAGLRPVIVDVDAFALENMYDINYEIEADNNVALINIGANTINMNIIKGGISLFTRDSALGSSVHTEAIQRDFALSYDDAERLKKGEDVSVKSRNENLTFEDTHVSQTISDASEEIINEVSRSLDYFRNATAQEEVDEMIISGGCVNVKDFHVVLSERLGIDVKVAEPFKNISIPKGFDRDYLQEIEPIMAVATGLALRRIGDR